MKASGGFSLFRLAACAGVLLLAFHSSGARAQAVNYAGKTRTLNVGKLIIDSATYQSPGRIGIPEDTAPYIFYLMNLRQDLKPRGWTLQNPLAPARVTPAIHDRWTTIEPPTTPNSIAHALRYTVGSPVTPDMATYWEVNLDQTPLQDLLKFDLLFISSHTPGEVFTSQEQEKLRKLVEAGGVVWVDDCWKFRISDAGRFFLPDLQFHGSAIGKANPPSYAAVADRLHPLITSPYFLSQNDLNHLGDKNVGGYYHTGFVPPGVVQLNPPFGDTTPAVPPNRAQPQADVLAPVIFNSFTATLPGGPYPYVSAGRYGAGYVIVTSGDVGDAINANCTGTTGYNIPAPDYDKNGGSVCGNNLLASDPEDLKFAYNCLNWASSFSTYRRGPQHTAYVPQSATIPLAKAWQFPLGQGESVESDPVIVRGKVFVPTVVGTTNPRGRLIAFLQDPSLAPGAAGAVVLWSTNLPAAPSSLVTTEVGYPANPTTGAPGRSVELLLLAVGNQVVAFNAGYTLNAPPPWSAPPPAWTSPPILDANGTPDPISGAPTTMDGEVFVTTQSGQVVEINPQDGTFSRSLVMAPDPNNTTDQLPPTELPLHYLNNKWNYMAASPAAGYIVDRASEASDPAMVMAVFATATQISATGNQAPHGGLLQFPIRVSNEHYALAAGRQLSPWANAPTDANGNPQGPWLVSPFSYFAYKNPELATTTVSGNQVVATPTKDSGAGTLRVTIRWPDGDIEPVYYGLQNGEMQQDFGNGGATTIPDDAFAFFKPGQSVKWTGGARGLYNQIVLSPRQYHYTGGKMVQDILTDDVVVHVDYDVDEGDPNGPPGGGASAGPGFHPEVAFLDFPPTTSNFGASGPAGSAILGPPTIGLDDSVYFGGENSVIYSVSHHGGKGLPINWKYYVNADSAQVLAPGNFGGWKDSNGNPLNPVTLSVNNAFTKDIHFVPVSQNVIRSAPTVGDNKLFFTVTDLTTAQSRVLALDPLEFRNAVPPPAQNNAREAQAQGGVPITFYLNGDKNNASVDARDSANPVAMIAQYDPVTDQVHSFFPQSDDFTVDPESLKVTLNRFGNMYANLPVYVWYNLANGQPHSFTVNPASPPDEVHNLLPGLNVPPDPGGQYFLWRPNGPNTSGTTTYTDGRAHPTFFYPADKISNILWRFPDPNWTPGVFWRSTAGALQAFTGTPIGSEPLQQIGESSPALIGDSLFLGVGFLGTSASNPVSGFMALAADPQSSLQGYTEDNVGIYNYKALSLPPTGNIDDPNVARGLNVVEKNVVSQALNAQASMNPKGTILAPAPPAVTFFDTKDFKYNGTSLQILSTSPVSGAGGVVGAGSRGSGLPGEVVFLGAPLTIALDSYRLVGLDAGGNIVFEIPSTTKTTLLGADQPVEEGQDAAASGAQYTTTRTSFNRPASMVRVNGNNVLVADTGNDRVVEVDLGGNVVSEITRYFDPLSPYQPQDIYQVTPGQFAVGNTHLQAPTDAYQWTDTEQDTNGLIQDTYRLVVDSGDSQVVLIADRQYLTGNFAGAFLPFTPPNAASGSPQDPNGKPTVWYHLKVWGTQPSPSGVKYTYRNVTPYLVPWYDTLGQHFYMPVVLATVENFALGGPATQDTNGVWHWRENAGSSIVVLYGVRNADGTPIPPALQGTVKASSTQIHELFRNYLRPIQHPVYARMYFGKPNGTPFPPVWHLMFIDQGAPYTVAYANGAPTPVQNGVGNWGAYDMLLVNNGAFPPVAPDQVLAGSSFVPQAVGSLDDLDYATMTAPPDIYYGLVPPYSPPAFQPTSLEYLPLTNSILISNSALNSLANPTLPFNDPNRMIGPGGEVLLVDATPFFHLGATYQPDNSLNPSIQFRSIPVQGSYVLQQVVAADRTYNSP